jgi:hypothetical protein
MNAKRPTNSELRLSRLDDADSQREPQRGILELFRRPKPKADADADAKQDDDAAAPPDSPS